MSALKVKLCHAAGSENSVVRTVQNRAPGTIFLPVPEVLDQRGSPDSETLLQASICRLLLIKK